MTFETFMNKAWNSKEIVGMGVVKQQNLGYGSRPDIKLLIESPFGTEFWVSCKELYNMDIEVEFV